MLPFQQRVIDEKKELDTRIHALSAFLLISMFKSLDSEEQERLKKQHELMIDLSTVLGQRIAAFR